MNKIKLSVAALLIAGSSYGQAPQDSVKISKADLQMILIDLDDILSWQQFDIEEAEASGEDAKCGKFEEKWGSNYWLTLMYNKLVTIYNEQD
tara:strand:+ start:412 stop:687 length:276 start_codon:yes stop_codon:yes gene_type:complete